MIYNVSIDVSGCTSLKEIILPKGLIETNEFAQGCSKLEKVQLPETLLELPDNCFSDCTMLSQINLDKIEKIGSNTFLNCKGLKGELNLESTNTIRARAFAGCTGITSVTLSDKISSIGHSSMRLKDLKMNTNMVANPFPGCTSLEKITIPDGTPYQVIDNVLYSGNLEVLICVPASRNGKYIVKYGVKRIAHFAFEGAAVSEIVLSNSVYEVASLAIFRCDVQSITIPKDVYCLQTRSEERRVGKEC